ncbi:hypothetical protein AAG601_06640 [Citromicrobium bathyomarinum]
MRAVVLNPEQEAMLRRLKTATAQFDDTPLLRADPNAINGVRELIGEAAAIKMPTASYVGLQLYVSSYDNEMALPEHLRDMSRLSGE